MPDLKMKTHWRKRARKAPECRDIARMVVGENVTDLSVNSYLIFAPSFQRTNRFEYRCQTQVSKPLKSPF